MEGKESKSSRNVVDWITDLLAALPFPITM